MPFPGILFRRLLVFLANQYFFSSFGHDIVWILHRAKISQKKIERLARSGT